MERSRHAPLAFVLLLAAPGLALGQPRPLTLSPVGAPLPGSGPVGLAIAETSGGGTFAVIADNVGNQVRSYRLDRTTGTLSPVGAVPLPNGPSAVAISPGGRFALVTTLRGNDVTSYAIDRTTGTLSPVGSIPSGGSGPVNLDISDDGYAVIANKDSDQLGVVRIDRQSGTLSPVGAFSVGDAPNDVKVSGRHVVVGHSISTDVRLLWIEQQGALYPLDTRSVGSGALNRVTGVSIRGPLVAAGTIGGDVHGFLIAGRRLLSIGSAATGSDITDLTISERGTLFVTGGLPGRVSAFELDFRLRLQQVGTVTLPPLSSRTLATVSGRGQTTWVLANDLQGNQTWVISATR